MSKIEKGVNEASKSLEESDDAWHLVRFRNRDVTILMYLGLQRYHDH